MTLKKQKQKSIATRARMLYAYLPVITSLILLIVVIIVANGIANVHASRIARQYSIEAAGNFQAHIDPHFTLMMQLSRSTTIARWMSDDTNELLTDHAFEEIIGFATYAPTSRFMFTSYETFNIYDFLPGATDWLTRETFTSLGQLIPGPEAQWFFQTRDWDLFFNFNIQREMDVQGLDPDTLQMWLNQRVYYQGGFVGVVAIGIPFRYVFEPTFGGFVAGEMRGYILDHNGEVRADSAWELDVFEDGLPTFLPMPESLDNPNLAEHVQRHLAQRVGGIYQLGAHTFAAVPLSRGMYSYASIAPIIGTDWSIAVLSYHTGIFGFQYAPVVFLFVGMMMFSIIIGSVLTRRIVIDPLFELTKSVAKVDTLKNAKIYGMDRDDEFGKLANAIYTAKQEAAKAHEERQRLEVAEESSRAKSKFLAKMSHEIRTPITAVMGISEIHLKQKGLDAPIEDSFAKIYNSSNLLLNIVNDILDISKIESGHMTLMEDEYEISSVIVGACHRSTVYYGDKGIDFKLDVDENLPATLIGDAMRIEQIINNLLSNAFKYTESGSVELSVRRAEGEGEGTALKIIVSDTGIGMSEEHLASAFEDFTRFHEYGKQYISGTGLGLSIVNNFVHLMNGEIRLESTVGVGTVVTVLLPQKLTGTDVLGADAVARLQQFEAESLYADVQDFALEPMPYGKVLVVDDTRANLHVIEGLLAFYDIDVETCDNGLDAIAKIEEGKVYDIIFLDHMMPGIDGVETMNRMRAWGYTGTIVAFTANTMVGQAEAFLEHGFDDFISKPIPTKVLDGILNRHIRDKQPPEVLAKAAEMKLAQRPTLAGLADFQKNTALIEKLHSDFVKSYQNAFVDISRAISADDFKDARHKTHSLKGFAGLINKPALASYAEEVENSLEQGEVPQADKMAALERELAQVLKDIAATLTTTADEGQDQAATIELLQKLIPLLETRKTEARDFLEELRAIPEAAILVWQLEKFDFPTALKNANALIELLKNQSS